MARGRTLWQVAVTVGIVGGILSAAIGTIFSSLVAWLMPTMTPYSSPDLVFRSLTLLCVGYGLKPMVVEKWLVSGLVLGCSASLLMVLFPTSAHSLLPFHCSTLTILPAGLAGMALREIAEETSAGDETPTLTSDGSKHR
jgi:hypothetical protein